MKSEIEFSMLYNVDFLKITFILFPAFPWLAVC